MAQGHLPADICVGNTRINEHTRTRICTPTRKLSPARQHPPPALPRHTVRMAAMRSEIT